MNKQKVQELAHLAAGLLILVQGFEDLEKEEFKLAAAYFGLSLLFMVVAGLHKGLKQKFLRADSAIFFVEAITILNVGWNFKTKGHLTFYILFATIAALYMCLCIWSMRTEEQVKRRSGRKKHRRHSSSSGHHHKGRHQEEIKDRVSNNEQR